MLSCSGDKIADDEGCPPEVQRVVKRVQSLWMMRL